MAYKLLAFDLDGSFLDDEKNIPQVNMDALCAAAERGCIIVPATGRILRVIPEEIKKLPFIRYYITANGATLYDAAEDKQLYSGDIPVETAIKAFEYIESIPAIYDCYQDDRGWMSEKMHDELDLYFAHMPRMLEMVKRARARVPELKAFLAERGRPVQKLQLYFRTWQNDEKLRQMELIPQLFPGLVSTSSLGINIELNSVNAGKDKALAALCRHLGIELKDCLAIGDGGNDLLMLRAAGLGVAMENAEEEVKAAADCVAENNNIGGLGRFVLRLLESGEIY